MPRAPELDDIALSQVGIVEHEAHSFDREPEIMPAEAEQMALATGHDTDPDEIAVHFGNRRLVHVLDTHLNPADSYSQAPMSGFGINEALPGATNFG